MKIAIVGTFPPYRGGITHFNVTLFRTLQKEHDVKAYNFSVQYPVFLFPGKTQYEESANKDYDRYPRILNAVNPCNWKKVGRRIGKERPDLVIFKFWMPFFAPAFGSVAKKIKHVSPITKILVILDNVIPHEPKWWDLPVTKNFFKKVDHFIAMSNSVRDDLLSIFSDLTIPVVAHPIYDIFGNKIDREVAKSKLGYDQDEKIILYFGFIRKYKGVDWLIRAIQLLKARWTGFQVIILGESYIDTKPYIELVESSGVKDIIDMQIRFVPDIEVSEYFCAADVVVLPYKSATQSGIAQIAFHFNRGLVVTDVGGLSEIVPDGKAGLVVDPNPEAIAIGLKAYFTDLNQEDVEAYIETYKSTFSWEYFCGQLLKTVNDG